MQHIKRTVFPNYFQILHTQSHYRVFVWRILSRIGFSNWLNFPSLASKNYSAYRFNLGALGQAVPPTELFLWSVPSGVPNMLWLIIPFLFVINIFSETDCREYLIVFIVIVNITIRRRPWSSSISAHVLVPWYYLSLILVGRCPILITLIICIWSCIDYPQGVYFLRPPLTWQLSLQRARLLVYCPLGTFCYSKGPLL